jgi:quinol monooxygenase YgiN
MPPGTILAFSTRLQYEKEGGTTMTARQLLTLGASVLALSLLGACRRSPADQMQNRVVRLAELEIDPAQLENYKAALREEIDTSIRIEPGVLTLYAVALKDNPAQIRIFETYADVAAYKAHIETPHFKKYKTVTQGMVTSLKLVETDPIILGSKGK